VAADMVAAADMEAEAEAAAMVDIKPVAHCTFFLRKPLIALSCTIRPVQQALNILPT